MWMPSLSVRPYPEADVHWIEYLRETKGISLSVAADASVCTLLADARVRASIQGVVLYEESGAINALKYLAVTAAGLHNALPVTAAVLAANPCLNTLPTLATVPPASQFATDLAAYEWGIANLLPHTSSLVQIGACRSWQNYTCGWSDPLGTAAIDYGVAKKVSSCTLYVVMHTVPCVLDVPTTPWLNANLS